MVEVGRNSFTGAATLRRIVPSHTRVTCYWCWVRPGRFRFAVVHGNGLEPVSWSRGFCSTDCWRCYESE